MGLKLITGRSGTGKTTLIMKEIIDKIEKNENENIILFVPDQMSFQAEYEIARHVNAKTFSNLQVLTFKRLAYRVFLEVGGANRNFINDTAIYMMLTQIMVSKKDELKLYNRVSSNYNFVTMIYEVIKEFKSFEITPDILDDISKQERYDQNLRDKMHDFKLIFDELIHLYGNTLFDQEDFYQELTMRLSKSEYIKQSVLYVDGYHSLTEVELNTLMGLIAHAKHVTLLLTIDDLTRHDFSSPDHLFHLVYNMARKILSKCDEMKIPVHIHHLSPPVSPRFQSPELAFLEKNYQETNEQYQGVPEHIHIFECISPKSEVHQICREIYKQVLNGANYNDFVIFTNNEQVYYPLLKNIFNLYQIPIFIDDQLAMLDHSLLNFIDAALEIVQTHYRHEAMFRAIKTEMFMPLELNDRKVDEKNYQNWTYEYRHQIDLLENYCLAHGINQNDWLQDSFYVNNNKKLRDINKTKTDEDLVFEQMLNQLKQQIMVPLKKFVDEFKQSHTVKDKITSLYQLLLDIKANEHLALYETIDLNNSRGVIDLNSAKKHKQVQNKVMDLFEQLVLVAGDYDIETNSFIKMLQNGFKSMTFSIVPPAIEQVMVGNIKRSRFEMMGHFDDAKSLGVKKAFVLGVNENEFPRVYSEKGLITNKERQALLDQQIELNKTLEQAFLDENFTIYTVMTAASEALYLSYSLSSEDKREAYKSPVIEQVSRMFPKLSIETVYDFPSRSLNNEDYLATPAITTSHLLESLNYLRKGYLVDDLWHALYHYYLDSPTLKGKLGGVFYKNEPATIDSTDTKSLYGDTITASVSSIEKFNACPYAYFVDRGLQLKERDIKKIEVMDIGDIYHDTLKELAYYIFQKKQELHEVPLETIKEWVDHVVEDKAGKMQRNYFNDNKRNGYLLLKIKETLISSIEAMQYQSQHSKFKILAVEEKFDFDAKKLVVGIHSLPNGFKVRLKGIIDRIDYADEQGQSYIRVIDYKSGNNAIDFSKIYHRLSLQLFTYLDVVMENSQHLLNKDAIAAGAMYYHVYHSHIRATEEMTAEQIADKHREQYKMNGYTLNDLDVSQMFDDKLGSQNKSDIIPVTFTKNGYHKYSKILTGEEMDLLREFTRKSIHESVEDITNGKIDIKPVRIQSQIPCTYCQFKAVCKVDHQLKENKVVDVNKFDQKEDVIEKIRMELRGESHE